jgi:hypothetical protein
MGQSQESRRAMNKVVEQTPTPRAESSNIRMCARCGIRYDWRRSPSSSLKMTYCGSLCEAADLGFTIEAILRSGPRPG